MIKRKWNIFWAWEHEEEEQWLADMEADGWHFKKFRLFFYEFEKGEPNEYQYRLELLPHLPSHAESAKYIEFMEDMGVEMVDSYMRWAYFRKPYDGVPFELYSDLESRIKQLRNISAFLWPLLILTIANIINCFNIINLGAPFAGVPVLMITTALMVGIIGGLRKIKRKIDRLEKERSIRE